MSPNIGPRSPQDGLKIDLKHDHFLRLFLMIMGKLIWQIRLRNIKIKGEFEYLILDCWRDKIAIASKVDFKNLVIMDGGNSTNTFGLVENWIGLGPRPVPAGQLLLTMGNSMNRQF